MYHQFHHWHPEPRHYSLSGLLQSVLTALLADTVASCTIFYQQKCCSSLCSLVSHFTQVKKKSSHQMHSPGSRYWMALNKWQNRRSNDITPPRLLFLRHVSSVNLKRAASRLLQAPLLHLSLWHWWFGENERKKLARETEISLCNRKCR